MSGTPDRHPPSRKSELIESIYRIALEPQTYDSFMGHWDDFILAQVTKLSALQEGADFGEETVDASEIANHFAIAMQLLEQAGRPEGDDTQTAQSTLLPQLLFTTKGALVWHNNAAEQAFGMRHGAHIDDFDLTPDHRAQVNDLLAGIGAARIVLVRMTPQDGGKPLPLSFQLSTASANERLFMATQLRQNWTAQAGELMTSGFGLSASEVDICALLAAGNTTADIAAHRNSAQGTVQTQIKKILQKTDCSGQVELVSLLHATMRLADTDPSKNIPKAKVPDSVINIQLPSRIMPVETFGDPSGTPVIFFHGMLDGNAMTNGLREMLHESGFHFICPVRPSFGTAPPDTTGPVRTAPRRLAHDIEALMNHMQIKHPIFLGHMAGSVYAMHAAAHLQDRVRGILSVSGGVPIVSAAQFASMSPRQRVVALTARYTPRILPFIIRAGISQLDNAGERQFLQSLYQNSPSDMQAAADPEISDIIISGYHFTVAQGHRAFETDSYHVVRDWSDIAQATDHPIELLHGVGDPVVSFASVETYHRSLGNRARLTRLDETGQLVLYQHHQEIIDALERLRAD
ncbi:alpha/beta fold hydrolase [Sulfitobacter sp. HNIBRBA2951]|uniref:alpha/beta fold hydrolase n=1 Tax=Sulfitobacter aquimarinus TaxID=3158557 RepID=UPI0032DFE7B9